MRRDLAAEVRKEKSENEVAQLIEVTRQEASSNSRSEDETCSENENESGKKCFSPNIRQPKYSNYSFLNERAFGSRSHSTSHGIVTIYR